MRPVPVESFIPTPPRFDLCPHQALSQDNKSGITKHTYRSRNYFDRSMLGCHLVMLKRVTMELTSALLL